MRATKGLKFTHRYLVGVAAPTRARVHVAPTARDARVVLGRAEGDGPNVHLFDVDDVGERSRRSRRERGVVSLAKGSVGETIVRAFELEKRARVAPRAVGVKDEGEAFVRVSHVVRFGLGGETEGVVVGHGVRHARFFVPGTTATTGTGTGTGGMGDR